MMNLLCPVHTDRFFVEYISSSEKIGVNVPFFIGLSQRTRTDFVIADKNRTYLTIFHWSVIWCTRPHFLSELLCCDNGQGGPKVRTWTNFFIADISSKGKVRPKIAHAHEKSAHMNKYSL